MYLQCVYLALLTYHTSPIQSSLGSDYVMRYNTAV